MKVSKRVCAVFAFFLCLFFAYVQTSFFKIRTISAPLYAALAERPTDEIMQALNQSYSYLGQGKQAFAFLSEDGKWVLKFFNQKYFRPSIRSFFSKKEREKRDRRKQFYLYSYQIARNMLADATGVVYTHFETSPTPLPKIKMKDRFGRRHKINLNDLPFVLQKRANAFYPSLKALSEEEVSCAIKKFLLLIASRIDKKISDGDHHVEHNFGILGNEVIQIDPGRLSFDARLWEKTRLAHEWWSATHQLRRWLEKNHPAFLNFFDHQIEMNQLRVLQREATNGE